MQRRFPTLRKLVLLLGDIAGIVVATYLAVMLVFSILPPQLNMSLYISMLPINIILIGILFNVYGLFTLAKKRYGEIFLGIFLSVIYTFVVMMAISFFVREFAYSRSVLMLSAVFQLIFLNLWQYLMWRVERMLSAPQRALIIGSEEESERVLMRLSNQPQLQYKVSYISTDNGESNQWKDTLYTIDLVIICAGLDLKHKAQIVDYCQQMDKQVLLVPSAYELFCSELTIDKIDDIPFFRPQYLKLSLEQRTLKRILDLVASGLALLALSPIFLLTAIAIKLDNKGPVFYSQVRTGRYEKEFKIYKFRSMRQDAEKNSGPVMAAESDSRITKLGAFLRRSRLDELPQFINVLMGDMSLVGPRPERPFFVKQFKREIPEYLYRHNVKPGITGMAQVFGKYNTTPYDKLIYDLMYIQKCSVMTDLMIMIQTVRVLFIKSSTEGVKKEKKLCVEMYKIKNSIKSKIGVERNL